MTRRRLLPVVLTALLGAGLAVAVSSPAADAATPATGRYTALTPTRVLNTRETTPATSGGTKTFEVPSSVPSDATSIVLNLTVAGASATGYVTAYSGQRPAVSNVNYVRGRTVSNLATVPVPTGGDRRVTIYNRGGTVDLFADLSGYVAPAGAGADPLGAFASVGPTRVLDTRNAIGVATRTPVPAGRSIDLKVTGTTIPADASAVLVNLTVASPAASGYLTGYARGATRPGTSNLTFATGRGVAGLALVPIGDFGNVTIYNGSTKAVHVLADVQGYVSGGEPTSIGAIAALQPQRLVDTRTTTPVAGNRTLTVPVLARGGVPVADVAAVVVTLTTTAPTANGYLRAYGATEPQTSDLTFTTAQTVSNLVVVRPDSAGRITVRNGSPGRTQVLVDVAGYVLNRDVTVPKVTVSRYTTDPAKIAGTGDSSEGCLDGKSGATFVLLDVGAQSRTAPLSGDVPGVALANTSPTVRRTYAQLVADLKVYLSEFGRCGSQHARIAIGTNTSGAFRGTTAYPAASRGLDWARNVVDRLRTAAAKPAPNVEVVGALDAEAGFSGSEADAEAWTKAFLAFTPATRLVYNGSLDACSDDYAKPMSCRAVTDENGVTKTWTPAQYVRLTYSLGVSGSTSRISVLPQIYFSVPSQAAQWRNLYLASGKKLTFEGSLTQFAVGGGVAGGYDGAQGWSALHHALSTVVANPALPVATDLAGT